MTDNNKPDWSPAAIQRLHAPKPKPKPTCDWPSCQGHLAYGIDCDGYPIQTYNPEE
jgi:hypothetical protein